jgi:AraC-like DNA-binding protein
MRPFQLKIPVSPDHSFHCFEQKERVIAFGWHCHPQAQLTLIVHGRGRRLVGDHVGDYKAGDVVLLGPNLPHAFASRESPGSRRLQHAVTLYFNPDFPGEKFLDLPEMVRVKELLARAHQGLQFSGPPRRKVIPLMRAIPRLGPTDRLFHLLRSLSILAEAGPANVRRLSSRAFTTPLRAGVLRRVNTVCRYIDEHFASPLDRDRLAALAGMTPAAFSRFFRRTTTKTPTEYIHELRVGHACHLLIESDLSIATIALRCGFANLSNFNRRFLHVRGVTPSIYRRQHQEP